VEVFDEIQGGLRAGEIESLDYGMIGWQAVMIHVKLREAGQPKN
jgi:hypothetical protein